MTPRDRLTDTALIGNNSLHLEHLLQSNNTTISIDKMHLETGQKGTVPTCYSKLKALMLQHNRKGIRDYCIDLREKNDSRSNAKASA